MITKDQRANIGKMKQRGVFQYYTTTTDALGGTSPTWNTLATVWFNMRAMSGREALDIGAIKGNVTYKIITRYRDDFVAKGYDKATYDYNLRLVYNGKNFNIEYAIDRGEENSYTELIATAEE